MVIRFMLLGIILTTAASVTAGELLLMNFELASGKSTLHRGKVFITEKKSTWSKGLKRSYLKLRCEQKGNDTEGVRKLYSTVDLFDGLSISHQRAENKVILTVVRSAVKTRLAEIRALSRNECKDMSPIVSSVTKSYNFPADGSGETMLFKEDITFKYTLQSLAKTR